MKILFVGLGSIGCRHIKNCEYLLNKSGIEHKFYALRSSDRALDKDIDELLQKSYYSYSEIDTDFDVAFITNPTLVHRKAIISLLPVVKNMFIEKPLFNSGSYDIADISFGNGVYYVACPLRHTKVFGELQAFVKTNRVFAARAICSSYLPDWRPNTDYRRGYSARKELGGGVEYDLVHEWDYICALFGVPNTVKSVCGKYSSLEIDTNDTALYLAEYDNMTVELHLDYYGAVGRRQIELFTDDDIIVGDFYQHKIERLKSKQLSLYLEESNDCYLKELEYFLGLLNDRSKYNTNDVFRAHQILKLAEGITK